LLYTQLNGKVDKQQLSAIDGEVVAVVNSMVNGVSIGTNLLKPALDSKLTATSVCQCVDPRTIQSLNATLTAAVVSINSTLSCHGRGLVYSAAANACAFAATRSDCSITIPNLDSRATSPTCSGPNGVHSDGAQCTMGCVRGYAATSATYLCASNGTWVSSNPLQCVPLACPTLSLAAGVTALNGTTGTTGAVRTFACSAAEYVLSGAASTTCLDSGSWSAPTPLCLRKWELELSWTFHCRPNHCSYRRITRCLFLSHAHLVCSCAVRDASQYFQWRQQLLLWHSQRL